MVCPIWLYSIWMVVVCVCLGDGSLFPGGGGRCYKTGGGGGSFTPTQDGGREFKPC